MSSGNGNRGSRNAEVVLSHLLRECSMGLPSLKSSVRFSFCVGLLIVLRIVLFGYFLLIHGEVYSPDSNLYLQLAANISDHFVFSRETVAPFAPEVFRTPGYPAFLAIFHKF